MDSTPTEEMDASPIAADLITQTNCKHFVSLTPAGFLYSGNETWLSCIK